MSLPWFRLYHEFSGDPNVQSLKWEDQRHFVVVMCLKQAGVIDRAYADDDRREAVIACGLGVGVRVARQIRERLERAGLLLPGWQPKGWDERQYESDAAKERQKRYREKMRALRNARRNGDVTGDVAVTVQD